MGLKSRKMGGGSMSKIFNGRMMKMVLDQVVEGIQIIDKKGKILFCNRAAARLDNVNQEEAIGRSLLEIYPSLTLETSTLLQVIRTGKPLMNIQQTFVNYLGNKITTINSSLPLYEGERIVGALEISRDITAVKALSEKVVELQKKLLKENPAHKKAPRGTAKYTLVDIIGQSQEMLSLKARALKAAQNQSSIMVHGSTGTGKELIVQSIHNASQRRDRPFIAQNCAALPATLLEGILFGTVKGSFTGAEDRPGLLELAHGGTLFLDEINSMPLELQAKLLRVLEEATIRRIGDIRTREVDVRIITAMNMDPLEAVERGYLRKDLYYRLNVVSLRVPDLKERREDLPALVEHFIDRYNERLKKQVQQVSSQVWKIFYQYSWPGNVRELQHVIEGAMNVLEGYEIQVTDLPQHLYKNLGQGERQPTTASLRKSLEAAEKKAIEEALLQVRGNVTLAAQHLQIPRQTLQYKMAKHSIKKAPYWQHRQ